MQAEETPAAEIVHESAQNAAPLTPPVPVVPMPESVVTAAFVAVPEETKVVEASLPEPVASAPAVEVPVPAPLHVVQQAPREVAAAPSPAPLKLEWPSNLQQVETSSAKVQAVAEVSGDDGAPKRVKRVRPPAENVAGEPLQQVETRN